MVMIVEQLAEIMSDSGIRRTRRIPAPVSLYQLQIPYDLNRDRTWDAAVGRRRLAA
jgi:hypothetical protein